MKKTSLFFAIFKLSFFLLIPVLFIIISCSEDNSSTGSQTIYPTYKITSPHDRDSILKGGRTEIVFDGYTESFANFPITEFYVDSIKIATVLDTPYIAYWNTEFVFIGTKKILAKSLIGTDDIYLDSIFVELFLNEVTNKIKYPMNNSTIEKGITVPIQFDCYNDLSTEFPVTEFYVNNLKIQTILDTPYTCRWNTRAFEYGDYELKVISTNSIDIYKDTVNVTLDNFPPTAIFEVTLSDTGNISTIFSFDASMSYDGGDPNSLLEVRWDFDGDNNWDTDWSLEKVKIHKFSEMGTYLTKLEVRDSGLLISTISSNVYVLNTAPSGYSVYIYKAAGNDQYPFHFIAEELYDLESNTIDLEVRWDFDADGKWDTEWSLDHHKYYQYGVGNAGIFKYTYQVKDPQGMVGFGVSDTVYVSTSDIIQDEFISLPAGSFIMGYLGNTNSVPIHNVTLTNDFQIGKYTITNELYCNMLNYALEESLIIVLNGIIFSIPGGEKELIKTRGVDGIEWDSSGFFYIQDNLEILPVRRVTWNGAAFYCNMLSRQENLSELYDFSTDNWECNIYSQNSGYRLPTEAEWEYSARYDDGRDFTWGNEDQTELYLNRQTDGYPSRAVGSYALLGNSKAGLCDLLGNIEEWCNDNYDTYSGEDQINPVGSPFNGEKVKRSIYESNTLFHNGLREGRVFSSHGRANGFRVVKK